MQDTDYWPQQHGSLVGVLQNEISYFVDCIRTDREIEVITTQEAATAVRIMEAAEASAASGLPTETPRNK